MTRELIERSIKGDNEAFEEIVNRYQRRLWGFVYKKLPNESDVQDIIQETFLNCFTSLKKLRNPEKFSLWLFRICQNCINSHYKNSLDSEEFDETLISDLSLGFSQWEEYEVLVYQAMEELTSQQKEVVRLRYLSSHSYCEIATLCNITTARVKSRLFEAKKVLKRVIPDLYKGQEITQRELNFQKEVIMKKIELIKNAAYVLKALSLGDQMHLCELIGENRTFDQKLLESLSKIPHGKEVASGFESRLTVTDLSRIITYERDLDFWIIENLEKHNPELAETFKRNIFVFEDILLLKPCYVEKVINKIDHTQLLTAIVACEPRVKKYLLSFLKEEEKREILLKLPEINTDRREIDQAQFIISDEIREMFYNKEIVFHFDAPPETIVEKNLKERNIV